MRHPRLSVPFLLGLLLLSCGIAPGQSPEGAAVAQPWFRSGLLGIEVGPTGAQFGHSDPEDTRYAALFDGKEVVRRCASSHADYVVVWARDGDYAYYDSKLLRKAPGLGERDPLRDSVQAARESGLTIIAYCVVQQDGLFLDEHPELSMKDHQGNRIGRYCFNSGYLEVMKRICEEILAYGVDGFHIDMLDQGFGPPYGCWCDACQKAFRERFQAEPPPGPTWDERWDQMLQLRYDSSARFAVSLREHIRTVAPKVTVDFNYHGNPPFSFEVGQRPVQHANLADFVTGETGTWGFSALTVGLNAAFYRAATPGVPYQVAINRSARIYHDQTNRPLADLRWELFTLLAHNAFVTVVDKMGFDGSLDPVAYDRIGQAFQEARELRQAFGFEPISDVGVYFSSRTRDWLGREEPAKYFQSFQGAHKALVYEHIPWSVVLDEKEDLPDVPIILVPHAAILSEKEVDRFRLFVEKGGQLILTGWTGLLGPRGEPLENPPIQSLVGGKPVERLVSLDNSVKLSRDDCEFLHSRTRPDWAFLVKGPAVVYQPTTARPIGTLLKPFRTRRQSDQDPGIDWPLNGDAPAGPAILLNEVGKGRVLTFACSPDQSTAGEHHIQEARGLIREAVRLLLPEPRLQVEAPVNVETVITEDPQSGTLRVHFLGYFAPPQTTPPRNRPYVLPALLEDKPIFRASVKLKDKAGKAAASRSSTQVHQEGERIDLLVEDLFETLTIPAP